uniref:Uncharacterized protein n=1 Tax=Spironucleus salmonicida TaxID=348837 RepID=V6LD22_9EUKA|eukprot:EST41576.1 Hypothetical protein SS50377_18916 [Spironucleus salmonicida]
MSELSITAAVYEGRGYLVSIREFQQKTIVGSVRWTTYITCVRRLGLKCSIQGSLSRCYISLNGGISGVCSFQNERGAKLASRGRTRARQKSGN